MKEHAITVGDLLDFIERNNIPRNGKVFYRRIEDVYFESRNGWEENSVKVFGEFCHSLTEWNNKIDEGNNQIGPKISNEEIEAGKEQYIPAFTAINYDENNLYITAHY